MVFSGSKGKNQEKMNLLKMLAETSVSRLRTLSNVVSSSSSSPDASKSRSSSLPARAVLSVPGIDWLCLLSVSCLEWIAVRPSLQRFKSLVLTKGWKVLVPWGLHWHLLPCQSQPSCRPHPFSTNKCRKSLQASSNCSQCRSWKLKFSVQSKNILLELRHTKPYTGIHVPSMLRPLSPLEARHPPSRQAHERSAEGGHPG